ncbi:hypothetical protein DYB30_001938, partial [Aphanomyces astaci]
GTCITISNHNTTFPDPSDEHRDGGTTIDASVATSAHAWRLEKRRSKYVKARQFLEEQFAETGVECQVRSLEGLSFASWKDFHDELHAYMKETNQTYISRDSKTTVRYNAEQIKRKVKHFVPVPVEFTHARVRFDCKHSQSNMSKNMNLFGTKDGAAAADTSSSSAGPVDNVEPTYVPTNPKRKARDGAFYSACPVKMHVQVHKVPSTLQDNDKWRVVVTKHVHVHNHDLVLGDPMLQDTLSPAPSLQQQHLPPALPGQPHPIRLEDGRMDPPKRTRAFHELFAFFTAYQASRADNDGMEFDRRYGAMYSIVYQSLCADNCLDTNERAMARFQTLLKPANMMLDDSTMTRPTSTCKLPPSSFVPVATSSTEAPDPPQQHYQL